MKVPLPFRTRQRRPDPFVGMLLGQTEQLMEAADAVIVYMETPTRPNAIRVRDIEKQGDEVRRALILQIKQAFITPIDREDLFSLSRALDDVLDYLYSLTREMVMLKVAPNPHLSDMAKVMRECARELHAAIGKLSNNSEGSADHATRVLALENKMDSLYLTALSDLFQDVSTPEAMVNVLKLREIYRHMIHAAASAEQAANLIHDILVKFH